MSTLAAWRVGAIFVGALANHVAANDAGFVALPLTRSSAPIPHGLVERQTDHRLGLAYDNATYFIGGKVDVP